MLTQTYYSIKPLLPLKLRLTMRRARAAVKRRTHARKWPIDPEAGSAPAGWPGWPAGKRFAFVLTHDVEGTRGVARIESLMRLEQRYGFRSSFNLVPEGEYRVSSLLRCTIEQTGCEVGVHGLYHDGKLYRNLRTFLHRAERINHYLREWGSCGFRSPVMQHRLDWLHNLNIEYDCSTFDTDPFEPQPDAAGTIFPFWVHGPGGSGYVELPYTIPQDFTAFVMLRERSIDIWKRKLEWIVATGGMVLLSTHPDYMRFGSDPAQDEYKASYYEEFLDYVRQRYDGLFWEALPHEVSQFYRKSMRVPQAQTPPEGLMRSRVGIAVGRR